MNGTREASKCWSQEIIGTLKPVGFRTIETVSGMFYHPEWDVTMSCHGDDFLAEGPAEGLYRLDEVMREGFEVKVLPRIGDPTYGGETTSSEHLHRLITWSEAGFTWQADPKYAKFLVKEMGLGGCKGVDTPVSKEAGKNSRDLDKAKSKIFQARRDGAVSVVGQTFNPVRNGRYYCVWNGQANGTAQPQTETVVQVSGKVPNRDVGVWTSGRTEGNPGVYTDSDWGCAKRAKSRWAPEPSD